MRQEKFQGEGAREPSSLPPPPDPLPQPHNGGGEGSLRGALPSAAPALINPVRETGEEAVAGRVVLACTRPDFQLVSRLMGAKQPPRQVWGCGVRSGVWQNRPLTLAGPVLGAPFAAMVLEKLIALGARAVVVLGWCGSLQPSVPVGSLVLPRGAVGGDGTSPHYCLTGSQLAPHPGLYASLEKFLVQSLEGEIAWQAGMVWTTDAYYRETVELVRHCQQLDLLAVDLELAALLAVGSFRGVAVAALLAVSDELFGGRWRPGQRSPRLRQAREAAAQAALAALVEWDEHHA
ncbi:MAG: nucleoside phosphorylase [Deltaproteobacteria bacterium]|nr:nucleoside phosphorylase [Deltaproteobacteria bacterium]